MIHEILKKVRKEHTKANGEWKDDIDARVEELNAKERMRVCPVCNTTRPKQSVSVSMPIAVSA